MSTTTKDETTPQRTVGKSTGGDPIILMVQRWFDAAK